MGNNVKKIKSTVQEDEMIDDIENDIEVKEKKAERFFEELPTDKEVRITIYKKSPISKTFEQCGRPVWVSDGFDYDNIVDEYGAGYYQFYAHVKDNESGKLKFIDSCIKRYAEKPKKIDAPAGQSVSDLRRQALEEMRLLKEIFPNEKSSGDNNLLILKMMEMMTAISDKQTAAQRESEKRMYETIEKMASKQTNTKQEIIDMFDLFMNFQNNFGSSGEASFIEKIAPTINALAPALPSLISGFTAKPEPQKAIENPAPQITEEQLINSLIAKIPPSVKDKLTKENFDIAINAALEKNPHISKDLMIKVGKKILEQKGIV